jgi:hypothetical protein
MSTGNKFTPSSDSRVVPSAMQGFSASGVHVLLRVLCYHACSGSWGVAALSISTSLTRPCCREPCVNWADGEYSPRAGTLPPSPYFGGHLSMSMTNSPNPYHTGSMGFVRGQRVCVEAFVRSVPVDAYECGLCERTGGNEGNICVQEESYRLHDTCVLCSLASHLALRGPSVHGLPFPPRTHARFLSDVD